MTFRSVIALFLMTAGPAVAAPKVAVDLPVTHSLVSAVMGDLGEPALLLPPGADPHHVQLRPSQARALAEADLLIWIGEAMSPWLEDAAPVSNGAHLALMEVTGTHLIVLEEEEDEGEDDHGHDHGHDHDGGADPHAWLDPENGRVWAAAIAGILAERDPENAATYRANAEAAAAAIVAAEDAARARLAPVADQPLVVSHDAYRYFAEAFGLTITGAIRASSAEEPGLKRVSEAAEEAEGAGARCLLSDTGGGALDARVAEAAGLTLVAADPAGMGLTPGPGLYAQLITELADGVADCAGG